MKAGASRRGTVALALVLLVTGAGLVFLGVRGLGSGGGWAFARPTPRTSVAPPPEPTATEPILPPPPTPPATVAPPSVAPTLSATPAPVAETPSVAPTPSATPTTNQAPTAAPTTRSEPPDAAPSPTPSPAPSLYTLQQRLGVGAGSLPVTQDVARQLGLGWYLDWAARPGAFRSAEVEYMPMIRLRDGEPWPGGEALLAAVDALPGALWLIGNEPDVQWQDNTPPDAYARLYHDLYTLLKDRDPNSRVAIGGVSQPTPLRLRYLDRILDAYQARYGEPMPVDVWNVHAFILREEQDSWGVGIPPGMTEQQGRLYEIADHDDMRIFRRQIVDFRRWMAERGQQDKPLIVTEYGILMPGDYGFPPAQVRRFMLDTFAFFRTATDPALGYPPDGHRLVQRWCWFSLYDERYPTGNLWQDGVLTPLGEAFREYAFSTP